MCRPFYLGEDEGEEHESELSFPSSAAGVPDGVTFIDNCARRSGEEGEPEMEAAPQSPATALASAASQTGEGAAQMTKLIRLLRNEGAGVFTSDADVAAAIALCVTHRDEPQALPALFALAASKAVCWTSWSAERAARDVERAYAGSQPLLVRTYRVLAAGLAAPSRVAC